MISNIGQLGRAEAWGFVRGNGEALLAFNEPDCPSQAAMSPQQVAALWPRVERLARANNIRTLVSPAMMGDKNIGPGWMQAFLAACRGCRIDAIAIHSYWCTLWDIQDLIDRYRHFGKPIWLTEFTCADPWKRNMLSMDGEAAFMREVVPWLEQEAAIAKYAWFSYFRSEWKYPITNPNPDAGLVARNGWVSRLGQAYRALPR